MTNTITRSDLEYVLDQADVLYGEETINDTYSGRGMYGESCLSVVFEGKRIQRNLSRFFVELGMLAAAEGEAISAGQACDMADAVATDDLGLDTIVYFPGWTLAH